MEEDPQIVLVRLDQRLGVVDIVGIAVQVDRNARLSRDRDRVGGALFRTEPTGKDRRAIGFGRPRDALDRDAIRQYRVHAGPCLPGDRQRPRDGRHQRPVLRSPGVVEGRDHGGVRRKVQGVHDRRWQRRRQSHRRGIEGVVVDDVVWDQPYRRVDGGKCGVPQREVGGRWPLGAIEQRSQQARVDTGIDHGRAGNHRARRRVDIHVMAPAGEAGSQVGDDRLRAAQLRFSNRRNQRRDDRNPHQTITRYARSRGGLTRRIS